jgi:hypothetical protein
VADRKSKRGSESNVEVDPEDMNFILEPSSIEVGSGYTLAVSHDENEKPVIDIKTYGHVDIVQLRKDIMRIFPYAQIRRLNQTGSVTVVKAKRRDKEK